MRFVNNGYRRRHNGIAAMSEAWGQLERTPWRQAAGAGMNEQGRRLDVSPLNLPSCPHRAGDCLADGYLFDREFPRRLRRRTRSRTPPARAACSIAVDSDLDFNPPVLRVIIDRHNAIDLGHTCNDRR